MLNTIGSILLSLILLLCPVCIDTTDNEPEFVGHSSSLGRSGDLSVPVGISEMSESCSFTHPLGAPCDICDNDIDQLTFDYETCYIDGFSHFTGYAEDPNGCSGRAYFSVYISREIDYYEIPEITDALHSDGYHVKDGEVVVSGYNPFVTDP